MLITAYNGYTFATDGFTVSPPYKWWGQWQMTPTIDQRQGASALNTGGSPSERAIPVEISYQGGMTFENAFLTIMAKLDPMNTTPRTLTAQLNDGRVITCDCVVQVAGSSTIDDNVNFISAVFLTTDPFWHLATPSVEGPDTINAAAATMPVVNNGATTAYAMVERSSPTSPFGSQTKRVQVSVTNGGDLPLDRETFVAPFTYESILSIPRMLKNGTYHPVTAMNTTVATEAYWCFPISVDAGETEVFDIIGALTNPNRDLDTYTRFDGNYSALDLGNRYVANATAATATTITDSAEAWVVNRWTGACVYINGGTGAGQARLVTSNTATQLTVSRAWSTTPDTTSDFILIASGYYMDGGQTSAGAASTLTDAAQSFDLDTLIGGTITLIGGTGSGQTKTIIDNTATVITVEGTWTTNPTATTVYRITRPGYHRYYVDQVNHAEFHRGGWQQNKRYTKPSKVLWGNDVLNGWAPFEYLPDNGDDYAQSRAFYVAPHYFNGLDADRRKGQDRRLSEEGQADGVAIYHPWGYAGIRFDYQQKNPNGAPGATTGICKFILAGREAGGDQFETYVEDGTLRPALVNVAAQHVNLTAYGNPVQLYMGQIPYDGVQVSTDAKDTDTATVRWNTVLRLWVNIAGKLTSTVSATQNVVPVEDEIRIGDYALQIGQRDGQRLYMQTSNPLDQLVLDCANARAYLDPNPRPLYVGSTASSTLSNGANVKAEPGGTVSGDSVLALVQNSNAAVMTPPAGFTVIKTITVGSTKYDVYRGTSAGVGTLTWTYGSAPSAGANIFMATYRNLGTLVASSAVGTTAATAHATTALTPVVPHSLFVGIFDSSFATISSDPAGSTTHAIASTRHLNEQALTTVATNTYAWTTTTALNAIVFGLVFSPASTLPTTDVTYAVLPVVYEDRDGDGTDETYITDRWLPIPPGSNTLVASGTPWASSGAFTLTLTWNEQVYG